MKINNALRTPALALVFSVLSGPSLLSQITQDYLQFSQAGQFGSARMQSMANAFHALGSGVTSLHLNPAASAVNSNSKMALGLSLDQNKNLSNYNGQESNLKDDFFGIAHVGALLVAEQINQTNPWRKISLVFRWPRSKILINLFWHLEHTQTGLSHYFANQAQGTALGDLQLGNGESLSSAYSYLGNELDAVRSWDYWLIKPTLSIPKMRAVIMSIIWSPQTISDVKIPTWNSVVPCVNSISI